MTVSDIVAKWRAASGARKVWRNETGVWRHSRRWARAGPSRRVESTAATGRRRASSVTFATARAATPPVSTGTRTRTARCSFVPRAARGDPDSALTDVTFVRVTSPLDAYVIESVVEATARFGGATTTRTRSSLCGREIDARETRVRGLRGLRNRCRGRTWSRHAPGGDQFPSDDWDDRLDLGRSHDAGSRMRTSRLPRNRRTLVEFPERKNDGTPSGALRSRAIVVRVQIAGTRPRFHPGHRRRVDRYRLGRRELLGLGLQVTKRRSSAAGRDRA